MCEWASIETEGEVELKENRVCEKFSRNEMVQAVTKCWIRKY